MSLYGHDVETTPNLDRWALDARVYEDVVSAANTTEPSHASMFTGLLPSQHGTDADQRWLADDFETVAEALSGAGYRTYLWSANPHISAEENFQQGFDRVEHPWDATHRKAARQVVERKVAGDRSTELQSRLAQRSESPWVIKAAGELAAGAVAGWLAATAEDQPWFAVLNYMEAHRPLLPERRFRERVMNPEDVDRSYTVDRSWRAVWEYTTGLREFSPKELEIMAGTYDAAILELDELFGELLATLSNQGDLDNTVVILTADHGELLGENHMLDHQYSLHEALVRIPLVISYPERLRPGREQRPVSNLDLHPTVLEIAGVVAKPSGSPSLARSLLQPGNPSSSISRVSEYSAANTKPLQGLARSHPEFDLAPFERTLRALYEGDWKYVWASDGKHELYDLARDPREQDDLASNNVAQLRELGTHLDTLMSEVAAGSRPKLGVPTPSLAQREMLKSLGYEESASEAPTPGTAVASAEPTDVFVIVLDAASAFYFGSYGDVHGTSPNLDRLARESIVFDRAYSQSATTTPSTASLITGVRVMTHRMSGNAVLPEQFETAGELFDKRGYTSLAIIGNPRAGAPELGLDRGYDSTALVYSLDSQKGGSTSRTLEENSDFRVVRPEDMDEAIALSLGEFSTSPIYAYLHYLQPHKPYDAPKRFASAQKTGDVSCLCAGTPCHCGDIDWDTIHDSFLLANETGRASPSDIRHLEALYRRNIRYVDDAVGRLLSSLRERDLYDEALIVVLADHGEAFFGHQRFGHNRTLYDDMVRIPLLMKFPARAGVDARRLAALVETVDIMPTIFDYLGFEMAPQWEGESLWPLIAGRQPRAGPAHREVVLATNRLDQQAIRVDDFKYIRSHTGREELYDLQSDPEERNDLSLRQPERARTLRERLEEVVRASEGAKTRKSSLREDPGMEALLEALGYIRSDDEQVESTLGSDSDVEGN